LEKVINPLTKGKIESWYGQNDTWHSVFTSLSASYEECRADSVALFFSNFKESWNAVLPELIDVWETLCYQTYLGFISMAIGGL